MSRFTSPPASNTQQNQSYSGWPTTFDNVVIGLDRDGTINIDRGEYITDPSQLSYIPGSLEAIRQLRIRGHRVVILTNQAGIAKGVQTQQQVDAVHNKMMQDFGTAGILSIDGLYYSTSNLREDKFAKPNIGMFERAALEHKLNWKRGYYVGDKISDLKAADKIGAIPVLVLTGHGAETLQTLDKFSNKELKKKTLVYESLSDFVSSLK